MAVHFSLLRVGDAVGLIYSTTLSAFVLTAFAANVASASFGVVFTST